MPADPVSLLRAHGPLSASRLAQLMKASRPTLSRAVKAAGGAIVKRGSGRRTHYAARRALRGSLLALPLYRIDADGRLHHIADMHLVHPDGTVIDTPDRLGWPLDDAMKDGWFEGLPYPIQDMRPQGFLGRHFARNHATLLQVSEDPATWSDDDALHALSLLGDDAPGDLLLGAAACRRWLDKVQRLTASRSAEASTDADVAWAYPELAAQALAHGVAGS
ncbi:MAG: DNA-binding protein, partial [Gammaproteobacteria bacterium]|nr:DNA-binding protein [Gammaproteobacteria bacterium]